MDDALNTQVRHPTQSMHAKRTQELISLDGGSIEQAGRKYFIVGGHITHFNQNTNEARGELTLLTSRRLSLLTGPITIRIHQLEFEVRMLNSVMAPMRGEVSMRFVAWLRPSLKTIKYDTEALRELVTHA
jgi:hypothetical protein